MIGLLEIAAAWGAGLAAFIFAMWRLRQNIAAFFGRIDDQSEEWRS